MDVGMHSTYGDVETAELHPTRCCSTAARLQSTPYFLVLAWVDRWSGPHEAACVGCCSGRLSGGRTGQLSPMGEAWPLSVSLWVGDGSGVKLQVVTVSGPVRPEEAAMSCSVMPCCVAASIPHPTDLQVSGNGRIRSRAPHSRQPAGFQGEIPRAWRKRDGGEGQRCMTPSVPWLPGAVPVPAASAVTQGSCVSALACSLCFRRQRRVVDLRNFW